MVGRAEWSVLYKGNSLGKNTRDRVYFGGLDRLAEGHTGQNARDTLCEHGLACAGRAYQQYVMAACGSYLKGTLCLFLSLYVGKIKIKNVRLGENIRDIGQAAFYDCSSLTGITFNESLKNIGFGAFFKCISLKSIGVPESVEKIDGSAFMACYSLNSIKLPASDCEIGADAFKETGYYNYVKNRNFSCAKPKKPV